MGEPLDTVIYTYEDDILTSYDGKAVSGYQWGTYIYDGWTYETVRGNRLVRMSKWDYDANCEVARTFTYDANGMRTQRVEPDGTTYNYVYNGGLLSQMTVDNNTSSVTEYTLFFTYDAAGIPTSVTVNGTTYYYVTNLQGDVVAILDSHGGTVAKYVYDAWGNILDSAFFFRELIHATGQYKYNEDTSANAIGRLNPLRYRGYVYDTETGWYYLQSRYYNPQWGRFITGDAYVSTGQGLLGYNMFAYCNNNPVNFIDPTGNISIALALGVFAVGFVIGFVTGAMPSKEEHYNRNQNQLDVFEMDPQEILNSDEWEKKPDNANIYHRHTMGEQGEDAKDNVKYMTKDGRKEVIINFSDNSNPKIVTDPFNVGTYNFGTNKFTHALQDILPYYIWGNSEVDSGWKYLWKRIRGAK